MLFAGHSHRQEHVSAKDLTWQEVIYKCRVKLQRVPLIYDEEEGHGTKHLQAQAKIDEYCYELCLVEDLDDGRVHEVEESKQPPGCYEDVAKAGLRARIPIHQISKLFYTNSGTLLGIEDSNSPILLIKRDLNATPPRKLLDRVQKYQDEYEDSEDEEQSYALDMGEGRSFWNTEDDSQVLPDQYELPRHLDPEWLALEIFTESIDDEEDIEVDESSEYGSQDEASVHPTSSPGLILDADSLAYTPSNVEPRVDDSYSSPPRPYNSKNVKSNLSVLECLLRLTILQNYQQASHLAVHDELLNLFLSDSAWSGSRESRQLERENARRRIGFDPFGSPTKQQPPQQTTEGETRVGTIQLASNLPGKVAYNHKESRGMTAEDFSDSPHRGQAPPRTPGSDKGAKGLPSSNIPSLTPGPWTPEQQLSTMLEKSYISSPIARKKSPAKGTKALEGSGHELSAT